MLKSALDGQLAGPRQSASAGIALCIPFATRARFLFKMDFAEAEYICRLRSGVKGHFSYRTVAWQMKCAMERLEPVLGTNHVRNTTLGRRSPEAVISSTTILHTSTSNAIDYTRQTSLACEMPYSRVRVQS